MSICHRKVFKMLYNQRNRSNPFSKNTTCINIQFWQSLWNVNELKSFRNKLNLHFISKLINRLQSNLLFLHFMNVIMATYSVSDCTSHQNSCLIVTNKTPGSFSNYIKKYSVLSWCGTEWSLWRRKPSLLWYTSLYQLYFSHIL